MSMENLVELQGIDTKLKDLNDLLGDLPSKVEGLNQQEESIKSSLQRKKDRLKELDVELHKREVDISQLDGKVDSLKDQLFLVTNNKQYDALMKDIDHLKERKSASENETIEFEFEDTKGIKNYINNELQYELDSKLLDSELYSVELWYVLYDITEYENQTLWKKN